VYYRRHVRNFSELTKLLNNFTKKDVLFEWTKEYQYAFNALTRSDKYIVRWKEKLKEWD